MVITAPVLLMLSRILRIWFSMRGAKATARAAKLLAMTYRLTEVLLALSALYILWFPLLRLGGNTGTLVLVLGVVYTLFVGGRYVVGSLFALVTVPQRDQREYFKEVLRECVSNVPMNLG
jgi:hypothetical protein